MSELREEKLFNIIGEIIIEATEFANRTHTFDTSNYLARIHQAYLDAGYIQPQPQAKLDVLPHDEFESICKKYWDIQNEAMANGEAIPTESEIMMALLKAQLTHTKQQLAEQGLYTAEQMAEKDREITELKDKLDEATEADGYYRGYNAGFAEAKWQARRDAAR